MTDKPELKPLPACPFCGAVPTAILKRRDWTGIQTVEVSHDFDCPLKDVSFDPEKWSRRVGPTAEDGLREALLEICNLDTDSEGREGVFGAIAKAALSPKDKEPKT